MDSFTLNKIAGAIFGVLLLVMSVGMLSDAIFHTEVPEKAGYEIVVAEAGHGGAEAAAEEVVIEPIGVRLASASVENGQKITKKCAACHKFEKGGASGTGPVLWAVVGRAPGSVDGFGYSSAMTEFAGTHPAWDFEALDKFLESPKTAVPKTKMAFKGIRKPEDRADLIAYLRSLSDSPVPLPEN